MAVQFNVEHKRSSEYRFLPEHITIVPELNGRHETPDVQWLINDILNNGQHTPITVRNDGGKPVLVAGFSRWRAVSEINRRKLVSVPMQLRATYVQCTEQEGFLINISENRFRNPTTQLDDAHNIKRLVNKYNFTEDQVAQLYHPTAKTDAEMKQARKFVRDRLTLVTLTPEAEAAVKSGRIKDNAATAIAKLSSEQQRELLDKNKEGVIERRDVKGHPAPAKKLATAKSEYDPVKVRELLRRLAVMFEDVEGMFQSFVEKGEKWIDMELKALMDVHSYVQEMDNKPQ